MFYQLSFTIKSIKKKKISVYIKNGLVPITLSEGLTLVQESTMIYDNIQYISLVEALRSFEGGRRVNY